MVVIERTISESSSDDIDIRPLEFEDLRRGLEERDEISIKDAENSSRFFSAIYGMAKKRKREPSVNKKFIAKMAWKNAVKKALAMGDPWEKFNLGKLPTEKARRHRYNALRQCWVVDEILIKIDKEPFNHGAMRECYRMKKLSNFARSDDWHRAHNYVAKCYMNEEVPRKTYFDDVKLQMDAKLWGEEYNRHNPPKKVDIIQMSVMELYGREDKPVFHVEHFIDGRYVKYNSNSGFVRSEAMRMTPQAFSHFTFERSGHELIVVDVQGVGDLYTDPQIHTACGSDYGDGNLGTRGMALFFHSHICNTICKSLDLTEFDLAASEVESSKSGSQAQACSKTRVRGTEEHVIAPTNEQKEHIQDYIRFRSISSGYLSSDERDFIESIGSLESIDSIDELQRISESEDSIGGSADQYSFAAMVGYGPRGRTYDSSTDYETDSFSREAALLHVHLDLAKYHELNRFVEESESYDKKAAFYHLQQAAQCGILDAITALARIHLGLPHDILPDLELNEDGRNAGVGFDYLLGAAGAGDRAAMIMVAKAFDTGIELPSDRHIDWVQSVYWYEKAIYMDGEDEEGNFDCSMDDPKYQLVARQGDMYKSGGNGLNMDPNKSGELYNLAGELATEAMKGKLASKYFMLAEEVWGECEE